MPLEDDISALIQALVDRAETLMPNANPQDLALLGHAIAATRGTASMQAIIQTATDALGDLSNAKDGHIAALITAANGHAAALSTNTASLIAQLTTVRDSSIEQIQNVWLSVAGLRIGDMTWRLFPNTNALPAVFLPLVGGTVVAADYDALCGAWGLNVGQTASEFVTRYNATNPYGITVRRESNTLYLPNMGGMFPQGVALADMGKYFPDMLKSHTHDSPANGQFVINGTGSAGGVTTGSAKLQSNVTGAVTAGITTGNKNKPEALAGLFVVRAL